MYIVVSIIGAAETIILGVGNAQQENRVEDGQFGVFVPLNKREIAGLEEKGVTLEQEFYLDYVLGGEAGKEQRKKKEDGLSGRPEDRTEVRIYRNREQINLISLREGTTASGRGEIVLEQHYADQHGLGLGNEITVGGRSFKLVGIGSTPDYDAAYKSMSDSSVESYAFGTAFVCKEDYDMLKAEGKSSRAEEYQYSYLLNGSMQDDELKELIRKFKLDRNQITDPYFLEILEEAEKVKNEIQEGMQKLVEGTETLETGLSGIIVNNPEIETGVEEIFANALNSTNKKLQESGLPVTLTQEQYAGQLEALIQAYGERDATLGNYLALAKHQLIQLGTFREGVKEYLAGTEQARKGAAKLSSGAAALKKEADGLVSDYFQFEYDNLTYFMPRDNNMRIGASINDVMINKYAGIAAGVIVMALFTYVISVFVIHGIEQEGSVIGALYSLGVKRKQLVLHYLILPVAVTFLGGIAGTVLGFMPCGINVQMADSLGYFSLPLLKTQYPPYLMLYGIIMPPVIAALVNYFVIGRSLKRPALSLLRMEQKRNGIKNIELGKLGFVRRFQLRQQLRELRSALTVILGMFIALLILMLGVNCYVLSRSFQVRSGEDTKYEYMYTYKYPTEEAPEGGEACYMESLKKEAYGYRLDVSLLGIDGDNPYFNIDVSEKKNEITISDAVASKFKLVEGDQLILTDDVNNQNYAFTVKDIVPYSVGLYAFLDLDAMRGLFGQEGDYYNIVLSDHALPIDEGRLYATISREDIMRSSEVFINQMRPLVMTMVSAAVLIFIVVMYLMIKVMVDRSAFSISLMKIFGYRKKEIKRLYLNGNFFLIAIGAVLCIPLSKLCMDALYPYLISNVACGIYLAFSWRIYGGIYLGILLCYLVNNQVLVGRLGKMVPAQVLKNRE